jgi:hypothetical protein
MLVATNRDTLVERLGVRGIVLSGGEIVERAASVRMPPVQG